MNPLRALLGKGFIILQTPTRVYATNGYTYLEIRTLDNILITITKHAREERWFPSYEELLVNVGKTPKNPNSFLHDKLLPLWKAGARNVVIELDGNLVEGYKPFVSLDLGDGNNVKVYAYSFRVNNKESTLNDALSIFKRMEVAIYDDSI